MNELKTIAAKYKVHQSTFGKIICLPTVRAISILLPASKAAAMVPMMVHTMVDMKVES